MNYSFQFSPLIPYIPNFLSGLLLTIQLTIITTIFGIIVGIAGAAIRTSQHKILSSVWSAYVELIRNTPFIVQLFFIFFGLPNLGIKMTEIESAMIAMIINLGAYNTEIIRSGIKSIQWGQWEAARVLGFSKFKTFMLIILPPAIKKIYPALTSQCILVMLGSSVISQISVEELTFEANYIQSRTFLSFEIYLITALIYLLLSILMRKLLTKIGYYFFKGETI
ncbi:amino acid ABC transporter permease [Orbus mooreae]|uniref:amino acid ABC transporter permease n=1 Tax=Orbus mooreae TaxID=3074107 RepID=UPI00370D998F